MSVLIDRQVDPRLRATLDGAGLEAIAVGHSSVRLLPRDGRGQASVDGILNSAASLIWAEGIREITTDQIARAAGMSTATIYKYFADFEGIFVALGARSLRDDLKWFAHYLASFIEGIPVYDWVTRLLVSEAESPEAQLEHFAVIRAMSAVPSMSSLLEAGLDTGARLLAEAVSLRTGSPVHPALVAESRGAYLMLRAGLDQEISSSAAPRFSHQRANVRVATHLLEDLLGDAARNGPMTSARSLDG